LGAARKKCGLPAALRESDLRLSLLAEGYRMPSFGAPPFNHQAAALGFHPGQKAMRFGAFSIVWLECAFHETSLSAIPNWEWADLTF
jgi:hypothetical protein